MERLGVGIIGCGEAVQALHLPALNSLSDRFRIVACADTSAKAAAHLAELAGARVLDTEALLADARVDVVLIAAPDAVHADLAIAACHAKKRGVLVEKPPALNARLAQLIADAARATGTPVLVGYPHVHDAAVAEALRALGEERVRSAEFFCRIGPNARYTAEILSTYRGDDLDRWTTMANGLSLTTVVAEVAGMAAPTSYTTAHAMLIGLAIHDLPVLRRVVREPLAVAYARVRRGGKRLVGFGIDAVLETSSGGRVLYNLEMQDLKMTDWGFEARRDGLAVRVAYPTSYAQGAPSLCIVRREGANGSEEQRFDQTYETGFRREWRHLHDVVTKGALPLTPIDDAVEDMRLAEAILRKAIAGDPAARTGA
jgi:predicted dehydrogenase